MPEPSGPEQETSYLNCAIPQTHWRRLEALTPVGALNERFLGCAMRPSGVNRAKWCRSRKCDTRVASLGMSGVEEYSCVLADSDASKMNVSWCQ